MSEDKRLFDNAVALRVGGGVNAYLSDAIDNIRVSLKKVLFNFGDDIIIELLISLIKQTAILDHELDNTGWFGKNERGERDLKAAGKQLLRVQQQLSKDINRVGLAARSKEISEIMTQGVADVGQALAGCEGDE